MIRIGKSAEKVGGVSRALVRQRWSTVTTTRQLRTVARYNRVFLTLFCNFKVNQPQNKRDTHQQQLCQRKVK